MLSLPISSSTFKKSFLFGDGTLDIASDQDAWLELVNQGKPFSPDVDRIADLGFKIAPQKPLSLGSANAWSLAVSSSARASHQIQLFWPGSELPEDTLRGLAPGSNEFVGRIFLEGAADASVKGKLPLGPLKASFGISAGGNVAFERLKIYPASLPASEVLADVFSGIRLPQQITTVETIPITGEVLVSRFGGYLKLSSQLSYGYSMTGSREVEVGKLNLDLNYQLKLAASISAAYQLAGNFELAVRRGSLPNFARFTVLKSRESQFSFAADFNLDAQVHLKGIPDSADEFLVKALGAHAESAVNLFSKARQFSNLDELEKVTGKLMKAQLAELCQQWTGKVLSNETLKEFMARVHSVVDIYVSADSRIIHLYEDFLNQLPELQKALDRILKVTSPEGLRSISDSKTWQLISQIAGSKLHEILMEKPAFSEFRTLVASTKSFLDDDSKKEVRQFISSFKRSIPLNSLLVELGKITKPDQLKSLSDAKLQGLAEKILGKTFAEIKESSLKSDIEQLHAALNKVEVFKAQYFKKLKETADRSFQTSLHFGYNRATSGTSLLDIEIDLSSSEGRRLAELASSGDFAEVITLYNSKLVRIHKALFTHSLSTSTQVQINILGYGLEGFTRMLQSSEESLETHDGGLMHIYTTRTSIEERKKHGGEMTASTFLIATVSEAFQPSGSRDFLIRTLPRMSVQYDLLEVDDNTNANEMRQILDLAEAMGLLLDRDQFVSQLLKEFPRGLGKVNARYVVRYDSAAVQAAFHLSGDEMQSVASRALRSYISTALIGNSNISFSSRLGFAYASPQLKAAFNQLGFASFRNQHITVTIPSWFTKGSQQQVELLQPQKDILITLFNYEDSFLKRLEELDKTIDALRENSSGVSARDLDRQVKRFVEMADELNSFRQNAFFAVFDRLVMEGSGGRALRASSLVLEITPAGGEKVTKVLSGQRN